MFGGGERGGSRTLLWINWPKGQINEYGKHNDGAKNPLEHREPDIPTYLRLLHATRTRVQCYIKYTVRVTYLRFTQKYNIPTKVTTTGTIFTKKYDCPKDAKYNSFKRGKN